MNDIAKFSYFAGIIDGEGSLAVEKKFPSKRKQFPHYVARLSIINTNMDLMNWIMDNFGGKIYAKKSGLGTKDCFAWYAFGTNLDSILKEIQPYAIIKKHQIQNVINFRKTVGKTGQHVSPEMRELRDTFYVLSRSINSNHPSGPSALSP